MLVETLIANAQSGIAAVQGAKKLLADSER